MENSVKFKLRTCVWEITLACCFSCRYCGSRAGKPRPNELSTEECLSVADQLAALGCRRVSMIGGEVFMRPDWARIVARLTGHGIRVAIITNGFLFKPEHIEKLKEIGVESVAVSLDGTETVHDKYRQEGSFRRALGAIDTLAANDIPASVITTINSENAPLLEEMYAILKDRGISAWQLQACSPMGNASNGGVDYRFDPNSVIAFVEDRADAPFPIGIADNIGYYTEGEGSLRGNRSGTAVFRGCRAGLSSIGIDSVGNVRGCESMYDERFNEGNLREKSLREIWEDPDNFAYNRKFTPQLLTGKCAECPMGRYCAGGCRSYAYFVHGKMYEAPFCARNMKTEAERNGENGR